MTLQATIQDAQSGFDARNNLEIQLTARNSPHDAISRTVSIADNELKYGYSRAGRAVST